MILYENGQITEERWYRNYKLHRDDGPAVICYKNDQKIIEYWCLDGNPGGNVLAYLWLADINDLSHRRFGGRTLDELRDVFKGPLALQLMRPLPIPIRDAIYEHYCLQ